MTNLLHVGPLTGVRGGRGALYAEFIANPETAPYLVSSTRSVLWVERLSSRHHLRAAFRKGVEPEQLFLEVIHNVASEGARRKWDNVHPLTREGIMAAVSHLHYYELHEVVLLVGSGVDEDLLKGLKEPVVVADWMAGGTVVAVPVDRSFLGFVGQSTDGYSVVVVHNASRGMAIARDSSESMASKPDE